MPTVLITGASRGLGYEFAKQYAAAGWKVIGTVRNAAAEARLAAIGVEPRIADVTDGASVHELARHVANTPIDILISNAGIEGDRESWLGKTDYAEWEEMFRVNVLGSVRVVEALVDAVAKSERKQIIVMSSGAGSISRIPDSFGQFTGSTYLYRATKAALNSAMLSISLMLRERGVTLVMMSPGWVRTDMGGPTAPLDAETSISAMRKLFDTFTPADSGKYLRHTGVPIAW